MTEQHDPRPIDYASKPARAPSTIDAMEIVLWVVWALMLTFFALLIIV
jgi:hypothetical protein